MMDVDRCMSPNPPASPRDLRDPSNRPARSKSTSGGILGKMFRKAPSSKQPKLNPAGISSKDFFAHEAANTSSTPLSPTQYYNTIRATPQAYTAISAHPSILQKLSSHKYANAQLPHSAIDRSMSTEECRYIALSNRGGSEDNSEEDQGVRQGLQRRKQTSASQTAPSDLSTNNSKCAALAPTGSTTSPPNRIPINTRHHRTQFPHYNEHTHNLNSPLASPPSSSTPMPRFEPSNASFSHQTIHISAAASSAPSTALHSATAGASSQSKAPPNAPAQDDAPYQRRKPAALLLRNSNSNSITTVTFSPGTTPSHPFPTPKGSRHINEASGWHSPTATTASAAAASKETARFSSSSSSCVANAAIGAEALTKVASRVQRLSHNLPSPKAHTGSVSFAENPPKSVLSASTPTMNRDLDEKRSLSAQQSQGQQRKRRGSLWRSKLGFTNMRRPDSRRQRHQSFDNRSVDITVHPLIYAESPLVSLPNSSATTEATSSDALQAPKDVDEFMALDMKELANIDKDFLLTIQLNSALEARRQRRREARRNTMSYISQPSDIVAAALATAETMPRIGCRQSLLSPESSPLKSPASSRPSFAIDSPDDKLQDAYRDVNPNKLANERRNGSGSTSNTGSTFNSNSANNGRSSTSINDHMVERIDIERRTSPSAAVFPCSQTRDVRSRSSLSTNDGRESRTALSCPSDEMQRPSTANAIQKRKALSMLNAQAVKDSISKATHAALHNSVSESISPHQYHLALAAMSGASSCSSGNSSRNNDFSKKRIPGDADIPPLPPLPLFPKNNTMKGHSDHRSPAAPSGTNSAPASAMPSPSPTRKGCAKTGIPKTRHVSGADSNRAACSSHVSAGSGPKLPSALFDGLVKSQQGEYDNSNGHRYHKHQHTHKHKYKHKQHHHKLGIITDIAVLPLRAHYNEQRGAADANQVVAQSNPSAEYTRSNSNNSPDHMAVPSSSSSSSLFRENYSGSYTPPSSTATPSNYGAPARRQFSHQQYAVPSSILSPVDSPDMLSKSAIHLPANASMPVAPGSPSDGIAGISCTRSPSHKYSITPAGSSRPSHADSADSPVVASLVDDPLARRKIRDQLASSKAFDRLLEEDGEFTMAISLTPSNITS